jgi:hypothetical protein
MRAAPALALLFFLSMGAAAQALPVVDPSGLLPDADATLQPTKDSVSALEAAVALLADGAPSETRVAGDFAQERAAAVRDAAGALWLVAQSGFATCPSGAGWDTRALPSDPAQAHVPDVVAVAASSAAAASADAGAFASAEGLCRAAQARPFLGAWGALLP